MDLKKYFNIGCKKQEHGSKILTSCDKPKNICDDS